MLNKKQHINMWEWMSRNVEKSKHLWMGFNYKKIFNHCYACEEASESFSFWKEEHPRIAYVNNGVCLFCPIDWPEIVSFREVTNTFFKEGATPCNKSYFGVYCTLQNMLENAVYEMDTTWLEEKEIKELLKIIAIQIAYSEWDENILEPKEEKI